MELKCFPNVTDAMTQHLNLVACRKSFLNGAGEQSSETGRKPVLLFFVKVANMNIL
jgi:hypothetical protein